MNTAETQSLLEARVLDFLANGKEPTDLLKAVVLYYVDKYYRKHSEVEILIAIDACPFLQKVELNDFQLSSNLAMYFPDYSQENLLQYIKYCRDTVLQLMVSICKVYEKVQPIVVERIQADKEE